MNIFEVIVIGEVQSEVVSVMTTVETRVQDAAMTAIEHLVIPRVEQALNSVNASSGHGISSVVLDPDQRIFREISKA